jgi:murein DD-endopeptidase MepM/ murein hydrolase activator NlpD
MALAAFGAGCVAGSSIPDVEAGTPAVAMERPERGEVCTEISDAAAEVLSRFAGLAVGNAHEIEATIASVGLDVDELVENGAKGGPFIPLEDDTPEGASLASLMLHMDRLEELRKLVRSLPLGAPLDRYAVSSRFGNREDPIHHSQARHLGVDLIAPSKTPVYATAAGVVIEAGVLGPLGKVVEIDHGMGVKTRYAHLHSVTVKAGQTVEDGQQVGRVGSTGRTTGPHLHYEVIVADVSRDPLDFIRAGMRMAE